MKINWLAPLPPAKTGVARYSALVLPELSQRADVRCFTPQESWDPAIETWAPVATLEDDVAFWQELNRADLTICHLGNNAFAFGEILEIASRHPSLVVLHEASLFELFRGVACDIRRDEAAFRRQLGATYGRAAEWAAVKLRLGAMDPAEIDARFPMTAEALEGALGVLCHHPAAETRVRASGWRAGFACLPLPGAGPLAKTATAALGPGSETDPARPRRLICFGHFPAHHRLSAVFDALAAYPRRQSLHLDVYGELPDFPELARQRDRLALQDQVLFHGFVLDNYLEAALSQAEMALDLRSRPDSGSAILLEIWRHRVPAAVVEDCVEPHLPGIFGLRLSHFTQDLHRAWDLLLDDPTRFAQQVAAGVVQLEEKHRVGNYLDGLLELAARCAASLETAAQLRLERRRDQLRHHPPC